MTNKQKPNLPPKALTCQPVCLAQCRTCEHFDNCWKLEQRFVLKKRTRPDQFTLFPQITNKEP